MYTRFIDYFKLRHQSILVQEPRQPLACKAAHGNDIHVFVFHQNNFAWEKFDLRE